MASKRENLLLLKNGFVTMSASIRSAVASFAEPDEGSLGTVLANMAYYGYAPSRDLLSVMARLPKADLASLWKQVDTDLAEITGDNRRMDDFVVYKNFPKEVLEMSQAQYWIAQILMYLGAPNEIFTQPVEDRPSLDERLRLKVLDLAGQDVYQRLFEKLRASGASWQADQVEAVKSLMRRKEAEGLVIDLSEFGYRGNGVTMAVQALEQNASMKIRTTSATDVLRIAAGVYGGGDAELKAPPRFRRLKRPERRMLVSMLENCADLKGDFARRPKLWKRLLERLHPGDFQAPRVSSAYDNLYNGSKDRLAARVENGFKALDEGVLEVLAGEPGTYMRNLRRAHATFGKAGLDRFVGELDHLTVEQLLKVKCYLETAREPGLRLVRPNGSWDKAQSVAATPPIPREDANTLLDAVTAALGARVDAAYPQGVDLDVETFDLRLATNGQELASYGRGTSWDIPKEVRFIRTASYWAKARSGRNTWFDNGWNMFDQDWNPIVDCCWDRTNCEVNGQHVAVFSGDPTNSKDMEGRACQMIDLYLDKMEEAGIAYAVWSILCYSGVPFSAADEVLATLQWGEKPEEGKLYEPSRAQMVFPLKGQELTKYVAYVDVVKRKLVYMDAPLPGRVVSAAANKLGLKRLMPAFQSYVRGLPTVGDLFEHAKPGTMPVLRSDEGRHVEGQGYVFERRNTENQVEQIDLEHLLRLKGADVARLREAVEVEMPAEPVAVRR